MKIVYVIRSMAHFSYHASILRPLASQVASVHVLFDPTWSRGCSDQTVQQTTRETPNLHVGQALHRRDRWRKPLFALRELRSYAGYLTRPEQSAFYRHRWHGYLGHTSQVLTRFGLVGRALTSRLGQLGLAAFERLAPPDPTITRWLRKHRPDVVVASPINMRHSEEVEYLKAAKALGIPTVVPVLSWDNLTTKGLFHVIPDITLAWNQTQAAEATTIHGVPPEQVVITGSPFFDKWFEPRRTGTERGSFCHKVGLDPAKPFVVYLGSSRNIAADESWLVRELVGHLRRSTHPAIRAVSVLVRPHPANARVYEPLANEGIAVWPRAGALPDSDERVQDFYDTLRFSLGTVGLNTTGMIDAVIVDRPVISVLPDQYKATQEEASHFQHLLEADVVDRAKNSGQCVELIADWLRGVDARREQRRAFVRGFVRPRGLDRSAGEVAAEAIILAARGFNAEQIDKHLNLAARLPRAA